MRYLCRHPLLCSQLIMLATLSLAAVAFDSEFAVSLSWAYYLIMPGLALLVMLPSLLARERVKALLLLLAFTVIVLLLPIVTVSRSKSFIQFHRELETGMTGAEVQRIFDTRFPDGGRFPRPTWRWQNRTSLQYMMDATHDRVDSVTVHFKNRRLVRAEYMPD